MTRDSNPSPFGKCFNRDSYGKTPPINPLPLPAKQIAPQKNLYAQDANFSLIGVTRLDRIKSLAQLKCSVVPLPVNTWFVQLCFINFVFKYFSDSAGLPLDSQTVIGIFQMLLPTVFVYLYFIVLL